MSNSSGTGGKLADKSTCANTCSDEEIAAFFSTIYQSVTSISLAKNDYCLQLTCDTSWENLAVGISDNSVAILKRETLEKVYSYKAHEHRITGLRFPPSNNSVLWTSSSDGFLKMWDLRSNKCEKEFQIQIGNSLATNPVNCFDMSPNERIMCFGTELASEGTFLLFWDVRGGSVLGSYWDCHSDDITQIKFHPNQADMMATSATDGLINVFDISQNTEDDALTYCMNAEVTVGKLSWLCQNGRYERLSGLTDIESLQYWDIKEAAPLHKYSREEVASAMKRRVVDECYLVSVDMTSDGDNPLVLTGSLDAESSDCLRTLKLDIHSGQLVPHGTFHSKQPLLMTRIALYQAETDSYITAGECGVVRIWKSESADGVGKQTVAKQSRINRKKPY